MDNHIPATPGILNGGSADTGVMAARLRLPLLLLLPLTSSFWGMSDPRTLTNDSNIRPEQAFDLNTALWRFANVSATRTQAANNTPPLTTAPQPGGLHTLVVRPSFRSPPARLPAHPPASARQRTPPRSHIEHICYIFFS